MRIRWRGFWRKYRNLGSELFPCGGVYDLPEGTDLQDFLVRDFQSMGMEYRPMGVKVFAEEDLETPLRFVSMNPFLRAYFHDDCFMRMEINNVCRD